ncbi:MAG: sensor histidine kinase [Chthoniobacterales bacterium]
MEPGIIALPNPLLRTPRAANAMRLLCSRTTAIAEAILLVALIGWFDYESGDFTLTLFYFGPVALATWCAGRVAGWSIALLSGLTWLCSDLMSHGAARALAMSYLNAGMLVLVCGTVVELVLSSRRAHDRLQARLALRTISLAEVHHRVKNNLQIVSSLLLLQSEKFSDAAVRTVFKECRDRINAMARLHEQLYADSASSQLDFAPHLRELAEMLVRSHTPPGCELTLEIDADRVPLDLDRGILLSLIATELLLNPLKHAFAQRTHGHLLVALHWSAQRVLLTVRDNGVGLSPAVLPRDHASGGLELVRAMSRQLGGELTIGNDPAGGTHATISFPTKQPRERRDVPVTTYVETPHPDRRRRSADSLCA